MMKILNELSIKDLKLNRKPELFFYAVNHKIK